MMYCLFHQPPPLQMWIKVIRSDFHFQLGIAKNVYLFRQVKIVCLGAGALIVVYMHMINLFMVLRKKIICCVFSLKSLPCPMSRVMPNKFNDERLNTN
jgi:hypothetical protein